MMKRTKRRILAVSLIALGIALLTVGGILFFNWWNTTYITINGRPVARSCEALDMEGQQNVLLRDRERIYSLQGREVYQSVDVLLR